MYETNSLGITSTERTGLHLITMCLQAVIVMDNHYISEKRFLPWYRPLHDVLSAKTVELEHLVTLIDKLLTATKYLVVRSVNAPGLTIP